MKIDYYVTFKFLNRNKSVIEKKNHISIAVISSIIITRRMFTGLHVIESFALVADIRDDYDDYWMTEWTIIIERMPD